MPIGTKEMDRENITNYILDTAKHFLGSDLLIDGRNDELQAYERKEVKKKMPSTIFTFTWSKGRWQQSSHKDPRLQQK